MKKKHTTPAVVFHLDMIQPTSKKWVIAKGFDGMSYMNRDGKFLPKKGKTFKSQATVNKDYIDYMNKNGVFDTNYSMLTEKQMDTYRDYERQSKSEGCPKYVGYLSFDNQFLVDNGLMIGEVLDRAKLMDIARKGINSLIDKSNKLKNENTYWYAAIHEDTDNIHVHYTLLEYHRLEDRTVTYKGKGQDLLEQDAFKKMKSTVANEIMTKKLTPELTAFKRKNLIPEFSSSIVASKEMIELLKLLPPKPPHSVWQYDNVKVRPYQRRIDMCVDKIISCNEKLQAEFDEYVEKLKMADEQYKRFYGENSDYFEYSNNQLDDFYNRAGNKLLQELAKLQYRLDKNYVKESDFTEMEKAVSKKEEKMAYKEFKEHLSKNELLQAQSCLKKHSRSNDTFAYQLGKLLLDNYDDEENIDNGIKILSKIAEKKDSRCYDKANYRLGKYYEDIGNTEKAEVHLLRSAEDNNVYAMYKLGKAYLKKNKETSNQDDLKKAERWLKKAADFDDPYAQCSYGMLCFKTERRDKGLYYLEKSAAKGNEFAKMIIQTTVNREEARLRKQNNKRKFRSFSAQQALVRSKRAMNVCWHSVRSLMSEYDYHIKKLQEEYDYENNIVNEMDGYSYSID